MCDSALGDSGYANSCRTGIKSDGKSVVSLDENDICGSAEDPQRSTQTKYEVLISDIRSTRFERSDWPAIILPPVAGRWWLLPPPSPKEEDEAESRSGDAKKMKGKIRVTEVRFQVSATMEITLSQRHPHSSSELCK
jgi:hypothetical protein